MKTFEFTEQEIKDLRKAINFYADYVYLEDGPYKRAKALANRIAPKKVTKEGWVTVYPDRSIAGVYDTEERAKKQRGLDYNGQVIRIEWEQEE